MYLGILVQRLSTSEGERVKLKGNNRRLHIRIEDARKERALMVDDFSVRIARVSQQLQLEEMDRLKLSIQHQRLFDAKVQLERNNHYLQAKVSRLSEQLAATADVDVGIPTPAESRVAAWARSCVAEAATSKTLEAAASTLTPARGSVGIAAGSAQAEPVRAVAVDKGDSPAIFIATGTRTKSLATTGPKAKSPDTIIRTKKKNSTTTTSNGKAVPSSAPVATPFRTRRPLGTINPNSRRMPAAGARRPSLDARPTVAEPAVQREITGKERPSIDAWPATKPEYSPVVREMTSITGDGGKVGRAAPSGQVLRSAQAHKSGGARNMGSAPSGRVLRSTTRAAAAAVAKTKNAADSAVVLGAVPAGAASPAVPARSTRYSTRR